MWLPLQVALSLFQLGLWTPPVSADTSPGRSVLQAEDVRNVPQSRVLPIFFLSKQDKSYFFCCWWQFLVERDTCQLLYNMCVCRYWTGYLYLCRELQRRTEAFSTICQLDDITLLEEPDGNWQRRMLVTMSRVSEIHTKNHVRYQEIRCIYTWYISSGACLHQLLTAPSS